MSVESFPLMPVTPQSRVRLHDLRMRQDGESWYVGRSDTGSFVVVPPVGVAVIRHVTSGLTIGQVQARLLEETGRDIDIVGFVTALRGLGMIAEVDGATVPGPRPVRPSLRWLRPRHVGWALSPALAWVVLGVVLSAVVAVLVAPDQLPRGRELVWSERGSLVLVGNAALAWTIILLHELGHLVTARAAGVPGRMSLGTRLQFLAAQTDVSGIWAEPRRTRVTVYASGIAVNLVIAAVGVWLKLIVPGGPAHEALGAMVMLALVLVPPQLLIFMRTDLYFLIQDLTRCRNLYADGSAFVRYQLGRPWRWINRASADGNPDPSAALPAAERRAVRTYGAVLLAGTALCLAIFVAVTVPVTVSLVSPAIGRLFGHPSTVDLLDSATVLLVIGGFQLLWIRVWWRHHGPRVRQFVHERR